MLTKQEKKTIVAAEKKMVTENQNIVFADFTGVATQAVNRLKKELKKTGTTYVVVKKRLLNVALKEAGHEFSTANFKNQLAAIFIPGELSVVAGSIHKFAKEAQKEKMEFKVLGVYNTAAKAAMSAAEFTAIATLPPREVLLAQVAGMFAAPIKAFMYLIDQLAKREVVTPAQ